MSFLRLLREQDRSQEEGCPPACGSPGAKVRSSERQARDGAYVGLRATGGCQARGKKVFTFRLIAPLSCRWSKQLGRKVPNSFLYRSVKRQVSAVKKISIPGDKKFFEAQKSG